ncbi:MAG: hypothetical protein CSYNP_03005 [Syntrophus sp. SKADARSKE-3]|nr:hypothetical protein [Syntrophus sp. SKADARSKE-3]
MKGQAVLSVHQQKSSKLLKNTHLLRCAASFPGFCRGRLHRRISMYAFPILNQSAIFVVFVIGSSAYFCIRLRRLFLAALISSFIWSRNYSSTFACLASGHPGSGPGQAFEQPDPKRVIKQPVKSVEWAPPTFWSIDGQSPLYSSIQMTSFTYQLPEFRSISDIIKGRVICKTPCIRM